MLLVDLLFLGNVIFIVNEKKFPCPIEMPLPNHKLQHFNDTYIYVNTVFRYNF